MPAPTPVPPKRTKKQSAAGAKKALSLQEAIQKVLEESELDEEIMDTEDSTSK